MLPSLWLLPLGAALAGPAPKLPATTLSGHLEHAPAGDSVQLYVGARHLKVPLDPRGDFRLALPSLAQATPVEFSCGDQQTRGYLMPGDQLVLHLDYQDFDKSLTYTGRGSAVNNYLAQSLYQFAHGPARSGLPRVGEIPAGSPAEAQQAADALRRARRDYLAAYAHAHPLPAEFVRDEQVVIDAEWAIQQLLYANQNGPVPASYYAFLKQVPVQELNKHMGRNIVDNSLVANISMGYTNRLVPSGRLSTDPAEGPRLYQLATQEMGTGRLRDWALEQLLYTNVRINPPGAQVFYQTFRLHNTDSLLARSYRERITRKQKLSPGQPAPAFTLLDNTGKQVALSDLKGQVVYLDFWGTWCGPCMREMTEFSHDLKKQFEGRPVVFLYVSVGDQEAKWQQTLASQHLTSANSVHLRAPDNQLAKEYEVDGYPSYYLIGRDGRLVQAWTSRPSDGAQTVAAIEAALN